jgi:hypothetical protein
LQKDIERHSSDERNPALLVENKKRPTDNKKISTWMSADFFEG